MKNLDFCEFSCPMENILVRKFPSGTAASLISSGCNHKEERMFHIHVIHSFGFQNLALNSANIL